MGKAQYKRRIRSARHHVNGAPINHEDQPNPSAPVSPEVISKSKHKKSKNQSQQNERQATIAVLDKISSPSSHDRIWSLAALSNLVLSSASTRQLFLSKNLVRLLINRLTEDADQEDVVVEVTGVLRNLVIESGRDVCGEMANKGILAPLNTIVSKLLASFDSFQVTNGSEVPNTPTQSLIWSRLVLISENVVIILWSLAETSSKWLDSVIALQDIIPLLTNILRLFTDHLNTNQTVKSTHSYHVVPSSCALASGQCLYALTEDHPKLSKQLAFSDNVPIQPLITLSNRPDQPVKQFSPEDNENLELLKVVSIGILRNVILHTRKRSGELSFKSEYDEKMPHVLIPKLKIDLCQLAVEAAEAHNSIPTAPLSDLHLSKASVQGPSPAELRLESIERQLTLVQLALELVGEWCASADGFDDEIDRSDGSDADEPNDHDEMDDSNDSGEHPNEDQGSQCQNEDIDMDEIPVVSKFTSATKANGVEPHAQDKNIAMDIEESEPSVPSPQSTPFSYLLSHLINLAKPTPYFYQSGESEPMGKNIIPTAMNKHDMLPSPIAGTVPDLICELLSGIHLRATDALNNMMITIDRLEGAPTHCEKKFVSTNQESIYEVWKSSWSTTSELAHHAHLSRKGKQKAPNGSIPSQRCNREQLLTSALTCFWSLSRVLLSAANSCPTLPIRPDQTNCLVEIIRTSENETLKSRALSALICLASRPNVSVEENAVIGDILIHIISQSNLPGSDIPNSLFIGSLDGIFDVYADETREYDEPVFRQREFLETIKAAVPTIQAIVKKIDKRKDPVLRRQAEEVQSNLSAFIDYRKRFT